MLAGIEFHWEANLGEAIVGLGTLALAWFTWRLARQTKREVDASTESIGLTRQSIEAQDMPYVIAVAIPEGVGERRFWMRWRKRRDVERVYLRLRLWNIGRGPAIVRDIKLLFPAEEDLLYARQGEVPLGPDQEYDQLVLDVNGEPPGGEQLGQLRVYYAHTSGTEYMTVSPAKVGDLGVKCTGFRREPSDGKGRSVLG